MLTAPRITIEEIREDMRDNYCDFTPDDRRVYARSLRVEVGRRKTGSGARVTLAETDRDDPTSVYVGLYVDTPQGASIHEQACIEETLSVTQIDRMIELLTLARDIAICEGMIEPASGERIA